MQKSILIIATASVFLQKDNLWLPWISEKAKGKEMVSLAKSASYLMHTPAFTMVRDYILKNSKLHIQDDTGIPLHCFESAKRKLTLYGTYKHVIPLFKKYLQPDLLDRYAKDNSISKLPFSIGYNLMYNETSLQVMQ